MQTIGKAVIKINGRTLNTMPGAKLNLGGVNRKPTVGANKVLGFSEEVKEPMLECQVALGKGETLRSLDFADASVSFFADTGQVYALGNAFLTETLEVTAANGGEVPLKISAMSCEEVGG